MRPENRFSPYWVFSLVALMGLTAHVGQAQPANADGAQLLHSMANRWSGTAAGNGDGATVIVVGLFDDGRRITNADQATAIVEPVAFDLLTAPVNLTATTDSSTRIDLAWRDASAGEHGFEIERAPDAGGGPGSWIPIATAPANAMRFEDAGLSPATTYYYRVRAYAMPGRSPYSNQAPATTLPSGPNLRGTLQGISPQPAILGQDISIAGAVRNDGDRATTAGFWVEFWAIQPVTGRAWFLCDSIPVQASLDPGVSLDLSSFPPRAVYARIPPGVYDVEMRIDATDTIAESREDDNIDVLRGVEILPDLPNLTIRDFDFSPQDVSEAGGDAVAFSGTIENTGSRPTTGSFGVEMRIGPYPGFDPSGPLLCDPFTITAILDPAESVSLGSLPPRTTKALAPGVYYVGVRVDPLDEVAEQREDDNTSSLARKKLYVGPRPTGVPRPAWRLYR